MDNKIKVAIADTNAEFNASTSEFLRQKGFDVCVTATDGYELLNAISEMKPDVVLLDTALPVIDGLKVMRETENLNLEQPPSFYCNYQLCKRWDYAVRSKIRRRAFYPKAL